MPTPPSDKGDRNDDDEIYRDVAGLTCVTMFSCCSLVESVVEDLVERLAVFFEEVEIEFNQQRELLSEAFEAGDVNKMIELLEQRSERYEKAVEKLLEDGRSAATRSFRKLFQSVDINGLSTKLKQLDEAFIPPTCHRQKRASMSGVLSRQRSGEFASSCTPFNSHKRITELKMTPKLTLALNRFTVDCQKANRASYEKRVLKSQKAEGARRVSILPVVSPQEEPMDDADQMESISENEDPVAFFEMTDTQSVTPGKSMIVRSNSHRPSLHQPSHGGPVVKIVPPLEHTTTPIDTSRYNCDTIMEDHPPVHNSQNDPGSNMLMNMFKSPLLKIQEKFGLGSLKRPCPTPKTPVRQPSTFHRMLKPLKPKKVNTKPDRDELLVYSEMRTNQLAPWGATSQYHPVVVQQQDWNPYSLFGLGVRMIAYEDVFKTPDFRLLARNAASDLRAGYRPGTICGRESRIERWYKDTNGYNTGEAMTNKQLQFMVTALKKNVDISHLAYQDTWEPCNDKCTHHNSSQPWVKLSDA